MWSLSGQPTIGAKGQKPSALTLTPRAVTLKDYKTADFVDVRPSPPVPGQPASAGGLYVLTRSGFLLLMRAAGRTLDKSVSLQVPAAYKLAVSPNLVACACAGGIVRLFATKTLAFKCNLPRPLARGAEGVGGTGSPGPESTPAGALFPDAVSCSFDSSCEHITVVYSDHNIILWDIRNLAKVRPCVPPVLIACRSTCLILMSSFSGRKLHFGEGECPVLMRG